MEDQNHVDPTSEYVIQLGQVLQSEDLEGIVNVAVVDSKADQVQLYMVAAEESVSSVGVGHSKATEHMDKHLLKLGSQNQGKQDTYQMKFIENIAREENIRKNGRVTDVQIKNTDESATEPNQKGTKFAKNVQEVQVVRELIELGSETSVTSTNVADVTDVKEIKAAKRREKTLLNKRLAIIPKRPSAIDEGNKAGLNVQPFTVETLKSCFPASRAQNRTRAIYDFLMYEKFPEGYTKNQKQALREVQDNYIIVDQKLYYRLRKNDSVSLLLVIHDEQSDVQLEILRDGHMTRTGSHLGINKTITQIKEHFYWHGITEHVRAFIKSCLLCSLKQTVAKEKDKWVQHNMKCDPSFVKTPETISMSERVERLSNELRRHQNNPSPFESKSWLQKLKDEVVFLNYSVSLHKHQKQSSMGVLPKEINNQISSEGDRRNHGDNIVPEPVNPDIVLEPVNPNSKGDNPKANIVVVVDEDESKDFIKVDVDIVRKEKSSKEEKLKMLETMLPRNREQNNSRVIEEIIRTNKYPKELTPGQIIGLAQVKTHYIMINNDLYRVFSKQGKMQNVAKVIHDDQPDMKKKIMKVFHVDANGKHNGMNKTIGKLNETFHWHGMSQHIRIFLEYCPICRYRRGSNKPSVVYSHVAGTNDISDICRKIANIPKDVKAEAVPDNLDLTAEDYQEVKHLAEEVKDLNAWLIKNPTIKEEWEHMYESNARGSPWHRYKYVKEGKDASGTPEKSGDTNKEADVAKGDGENIQSYKDYVAELLETESATSFLKKNCIGKKSMHSMLVSDKDIKPKVDIVINKGLPVTIKVIKTNIASEDFHLATTGKDRFEKGNATDSKKEEDMVWNVNLDDSVDNSVEECTLSESISDDKKIGDRKDNIDGDDKEIVAGENDSKGDENNCGQIDKQKMDNIKIISYVHVNEKKSTESHERHSCGEEHKESTEKVSKEDEVEMEDISTSDLKSDNIAKLELRESSDAKQVDSTDTEDRDTNESLKDQKEDGTIVQRFSRRLRVKADKGQTDVKLNTNDTETKFEVQTVHLEQMQVGNEKYESPTTKCTSKRTQSLTQHVQNENTQNVETDTPTRKSARIRTLTPKFCGFVKSRVVEALAMSSGSNEKQGTHVENEIAADNLDNLNSGNSMRKVQEKTQKRIPSTDKPQQEQIKSKGCTGSTPKTKPIMRSSIIRQGSGIKSDRKADVSKDTDNTSSKGKKHAKSDQSTGTKRKGIIMKNSDVHVIRRQIMNSQPAEYKDTKNISNEGNKHIISESITKGYTMKNGDVSIKRRQISHIQLAEHSSSKIMRHSTDTVIKNFTNINDNVMGSKETDIERKNIIVPRSKRGIMTKKYISIVKQNDFKLNNNCADNQRKQSDKTLNAEVEQQMTENSNSSKSNRVVETDSDTQLCGSKSCSKSTEEDNTKNENVEQKESTRQIPIGMVQCETQTSKPLKYIIDLRESKTHEAVNLFKKQYNDFVLTTEVSNDDKDNSKSSISDSEEKKCVHPSLNVIGEQVIPVSTQINNSEINIESGNKGTQRDSAVYQNNITISKTESLYQGVHVLGEENIITHIKTKPEEISKTDGSDLNRQSSENTDSNGTSDSRDISKASQDSSYGLPAGKKIMQESVLEEVVGRILECPLCMKVFEDEKAYILHKGSQCNLTCTYCSLEFKSKNKKQFLKHVNRHETGVNFQCPDCQRLFSNDSLLSVHRRIYAEEGPILCTLCCARFYSQFDLVAHVSTEHTTPLVYSCDVCSARYGSKDFLIEKHFARGVLAFYSCAFCESTI